MQDDNQTIRGNQVSFRPPADMRERIEAVAKENNLSINMALQLLIGYALNEIDRSGKKFTAKTVFVAE